MEFSPQYNLNLTTVKVVAYCWIKGTFQSYTSSVKGMVLLLFLIDHGNWRHIIYFYFFNTAFTTQVSLRGYVNPYFKYRAEKTSTLPRIQPGTSRM
jgi:hypothetical protein